MNDLEQLYNSLMKDLTKTSNPFLSHVFLLIKENKAEELEQYLIHEQKDINLKHDANVNPLTYAVMERDLDIVRVLIDFGADVNFHDIEKSKDDQDAYPILSHAALRSDNLLSYLLNHGLEVKNEAGTEALHVALRNHLIPNARLFLEHGTPYENLDWSTIHPNIKAQVQDIINDREMKKAIKEEKNSLEEQILINHNSHHKLKL